MFDVLENEEKKSTSFEEKCDYLVKFEVAGMLASDNVNHPFKGIKHH
jgi:hypothetical protein